MQGATGLQGATGPAGAAGGVIGTKLAKFEYAANQISIKRYYRNSSGLPAMAFEIFAQHYERTGSDVILNLTTGSHWEPGQSKPSNSDIVYVYLYASGSDFEGRLSLTEPDAYLYHPTNTTWKCVAGFPLASGTGDLIEFHHDPVSHFVSISERDLILNGGTNSIWTEVSYDAYVPSRVASRARISGRTDYNIPLGYCLLRLRAKGDSSTEGVTMGYGYMPSGGSFYTRDYGPARDFNIINDQRTVEYYCYRPGGYNAGSAYLDLEGYYLR